MRVLNLFIFLIVGIFAIAIVSAQSYCSFSDNKSIYFSNAFDYNYTLRASYSQSSYSDTLLMFKITYATYFPTYIFITCNPTAPSFYYLKYYTLSTTGSCTNLNTIYDRFGITGYIKRTDTNKEIGNWVYYIYEDSVAFYATYNEYPFNTSVEYRYINAFPLTNYYCAIDKAYRYAASYTVYTIPPILNNLYYYYYPGGSITSTNILAAYPRATTTASNYTCYFYMRYIALYNIDNLSITYIKDSKLLNVSFIPNFNGYIKITGQKELTYTFSKNIQFNALIPYINNTIYIYDSSDYIIASYNLKQYLNCLDEPDTGIYTLKLKDLAGNQILQFKIIYQGNEYNSDDKGVITIPPLTNASITVLPLNRQDLAFNTTITTNQPEIWITANLYVYTVQLVTRQITILGTELPAAFKFFITGQEYKDKQNLSNDNFTYENTAYDNYTVQLLPGNYQIQFRTVIYFPSMSVRVNSYNLSLFDNNYYRKLVWRVGVLTDSFSETLLGNPLLSITVIDQNGKAVKSAEIQLFDENNNTVGIKSTDNNGNAQFYVRNGYNYTVKVYYAGNLKAVKDIEFPIDETVIQLTIQISITQQEQQAVQSGQTNQPGQNITIPSPQETQNQVANILSVILTNYAVWAFVFIIIFASYAAKMAGTEIGILVAIVGIAVFTFLVPWLPVQIIALIGVVAGIMFGLRLVRRSQ